MKRRRILLLLAMAAMVAAGLVLFWPRGPKEPVVEGKRITVWLWEAMSDSSTFNENTRKVLRATATNALPWLLQEFTRRPSRWRGTLNRWFSGLPVVDIRFDGDERRVAIAECGLYLLGPEAAPALPTLARYLSDTDKNAAWVMAGVGDRALPWLLDATASTNPVVATHAMDGLVLLARESELTLRALVQLLRSTNSAIRKLAAMHFHRVVTRPDLTVPPLTEALSDPELEVRLLAARSLGEMGSNARPALPALVRLSTSTNAWVAGAASNAVLRIAKAAVPELLRLMNQPPPSTAEAASNAVFRIDPTALPARAR